MTQLSTCAVLQCLSSDVALNLFSMIRETAWVIASASIRASICRRRRRRHRHRRHHDRRRCRCCRAVVVNKFLMKNLVVHECDKTEKKVSQGRREKKIPYPTFDAFQVFSFRTNFSLGKKIPSRFQRQLTGEKIESDFS